MKPLRDRPLRPKMYAFAVAYAQHHDPMRALTAAGYVVTGRNPRAVACRILRDPRVRAVIERQAENIERCAGVSAASVVAELALLALSDLKNYGKWNSAGEFELTASDDLPPHLSRAISELIYDKRPDGSTRTRIKLHGKSESLKMLGEYLALFKQRIQVETSEGRDPLTVALEAIWAKPEMQAKIKADKGDAKQLSGGTGTVIDAVQLPLEGAQDAQDEPVGVQGV